jgi:hypothetical protein
MSPFTPVIPDNIQLLNKDTVGGFLPILPVTPNSTQLCLIGAVGGFLPYYVLLMQHYWCTVFIELNIPGSCLYSWWKQNGMGTGLDLIIMLNSTCVLPQVFQVVADRGGTLLGNSL